MILKPSGNKHGKHNCLLRSGQVSAESSIFGANGCRQSRAQVRNQGRDLLHIQFWLKHEEKETQLKIWKSHVNDNQRCMPRDGNLILKRTPQDRFSGAKDIQLPIAYHSQTQRSDKAASLNKRQYLRPVVIRPSNLQPQLYSSSLYPHSTYQCTGIYSALTTANGKKVSQTLPTLTAEQYSCWPCRGVGLHNPSLKVTLGWLH